MQVIQDVRKKAAKNSNNTEDQANFSHVTFFFAPHRKLQSKFSATKFRQNHRFCPGSPQVIGQREIQSTTQTQEPSRVGVSSSASTIRRTHTQHRRR
jgi:hypothetical protein